MELNKVNLGLSGGIIWGGALFVMTMISMSTGYADKFLAVIKGIYPGYSVTVTGGFIGLCYGFVDAFAALFVFAWIYNMLGKLRQK